jgi:hypothetical protein
VVAAIADLVFVFIVAVHFVCPIMPVVRVIAFRASLPPQEINCPQIPPVVSPMQVILVIEMVIQPFQFLHGNLSVVAGKNIFMFCHVRLPQLGVELVGLDLPDPI